MKKKLLVALVASLIVTACGTPQNTDVEDIPEFVNDGFELNSDVQNAIGDVQNAVGDIKDTLNDLNGALSEIKTPVPMYADFTDGCPETFMASGDWSNGSMFNVTWRKTSCTYADGKLLLTIDHDPKGTDIPYSGAELRSKDFYGYGLYEVSMKAIKNDGVVSSFFTYTGPSDNNPWDEIDVEILGKDTTKVQFNYFTDGKGNHEKLVDLGFDASEDFHTYGFEWTESAINWYVDGELVHTATENLPSTESKIMMNAWCGTGVDSWLNAFDDSKLPITAEYQWISYTPAK